MRTSAAKMLLARMLLIWRAGQKQEKIQMQRFKNNVSDGWLFRQELRLFRNFMRNWKRDVDDCDFFDIFANGNNSTENEAKAFLKESSLKKGGGRRIGF